MIIFLQETSAQHTLYVCVRLCVCLRLITMACDFLERMSVHMSAKEWMCTCSVRARFIESRCSSDKHTSTDKILQRGTRCPGRCRENNQPSSEVERRKARRKGERTKHERKINGRCLRRFSVALAKTGDGFMQRRRRNSTFLGKD